MHIPNSKLLQYRVAKDLSRQLKMLGDRIGVNDTEDSDILWRLSAKYENKARQIRLESLAIKKESND